MEDIWERLELIVERLGEISNEKWSNNISDCNGELSIALKEYFDFVSEFILYAYDVYQIDKSQLDEEELMAINHKLYEDILPENYGKSFGNPEYAVKRLGTSYGKLLGFLYSEVRGCIAYCYENKMEEFVSLCELFIEIYCMFSENDRLPEAEEIKNAIYYYMYDYADVLVEGRTVEGIDCSNTFAVRIIMDSDLNDLRYLYHYGEYISEKGYTQLRIAETEKYAHVTFFFNGGEEKQYKGEDRILVPSPKVETYDQKPEMSAYEVTEKVLEAIKSDKYDAIILNYANTDMVGHTGSLTAAIKAV